MYCLEQVDNGSNLQDITISSNTELEVVHESELLNGVTSITGRAYRTDRSQVQNKLYVTESYDKVNDQIKAIPYYAWSNRGEGEMIVWIREQ